LLDAMRLLEQQEDLGLTSWWQEMVVLGFHGAVVDVLAGRYLYWQDGELSSGRSHASEPVSSQESSWPQKESCDHKETCGCSYFIKNTKCPTTPMSCSILKKNMNCLFLLIFRCYFMGPNFWGKQLSVISKKSISSLV
jgi:hypothetical protein